MGQWWILGVVFFLHAALLGVLIAALLLGGYGASLGAWRYEGAAPTGWGSGWPWAARVMAGVLAGLWVGACTGAWPWPRGFRCID